MNYIPPLDPVSLSALYIPPLNPISLSALVIPPELAKEVLLSDRSRLNNTLQVKRKIWVSFSREGIHRYPAAYSDPKLATGDEYDVSFLAHPHRHIFNFKVWIDVKHNDRDIEFIQFKRWLENLYKKETLQLNNMSCEMIAEDLYKQIIAKYPNRTVKIQVDEDGENGCEVEYISF
jgi:hypothetical protein